MQLPKQIDGCPVQPCGDPLDHKGLWQTMIPVDCESDGRLWEFDTRTGRILQTREE